MWYYDIEGCERKGAPIQRGKRTLEDFKSMSWITNADEKRLAVVEEAIDTLIRKRRALEQAEDEIMQGVEAILEHVSE